MTAAADLPPDLDYRGIAVDAWRALVEVARQRDDLANLVVDVALEMHRALHAPHSPDDHCPAWPCCEVRKTIQRMMEESKR